MKRLIKLLLIAVFTCTLLGDVNGRGFGGGGFSRGGFSGGGSFDRGGGGGFSSFSGGNRYGGSYSGDRSFNSSSGYYGRGASGSYDHTWTDAAGGSINTSGSRSAGETRWGGYGASGNRDTTVTTAAGKTYSADRSGGFATTATGRTVGGASGSVDGRYGTSNWNTAFAGNRYGAMDHYSSVSAATATGTHYWSNSYTSVHANAVRAGYAYPHCFYPGWYAARPGCWYAAGWAAGAAYTAMTYAALSTYCGLDTAAAPDYDYGSTVVINNGDIYMNGNDTGVTEPQYAQEATTIASAGLAGGPTANPNGPGGTTAPAANDDWKPLGVFALVQGDEKTSNNIFQLAVNKDGIIRGNYYDGLMDTNAEVYGSVDKKAQRAAWTIGKKQDRVFDAGVYNLTKPECPCLIHLGPQKTTQMLLVRIDEPKAKQ